ncbi:hypothetical protein Nepgr_020152 [Nepenthes gracilis]|uniref:DUF4005 domain-containing protein n=1 Tax=Nepenthes gracilis TaxID=150966 RepID=A0AAD3SWU1_NEPGR|nr:hypothetical protein Nepgr_020152 [Nepenthes gracilis]
MKRPREKATTATADASGTRSAVDRREEEAAEAERRRALAVAVATTAAAEASVAAAQAAMELLNRPCVSVREHHAATAIQKAYRGYLAKRALRALRGLVKLQALIRGHNVRKRAKVTLQRMQALVRAQARARDQRMGLSLEPEGSLNFSISDSHSLVGLHSIDSKSFCSKGGGTSVGDEWEEQQGVVNEINSILRLTKETTSNRQRTALAYDFSNKEQIRRLMKQREGAGRHSCDQILPVKIVEVDNAVSYSSHRFPQKNYEYYQHKPSSSPLHKFDLNPCYQSPIKHYGSELKHPLRYYSSPPLARGGSNNSILPNYMAATASTMARARSQSVPRQVPLTLERDGNGGK